MNSIVVTADVFQREMSLLNTLAYRFDGMMGQARSTRGSTKSPEGLLHDTGIVPTETWPAYP
jgi:hypothetical protein